MKIAKIDEFESTYMAQFRALVAANGVITETQKDRAAFDLGMILTQETGSSASKLVNPSQVWFQLKGKRRTTASAAAIKKAGAVKVVVRREHLHFWYYFNAPVYLVVFAEATGQFYVLDMKRWIREHGPSAILNLKTETKTVHVPTEHPLSSGVFNMIRTAAQLPMVAESLGGDKEARTFQRDDSLIWRLSTLGVRKREMRALVVKYGSKMRSEVHFQERGKNGDDWETIRKHWQYAMGDIDKVFPYLTFEPPEDAQVYRSEEATDEEGHTHYSLEPDGDFISYDDEDTFEDGELFELPDKRLLRGEGQFEMFQFDLRPTLNTIGKQWAAALHSFISTGFLAISDEPIWVSVAPWNKPI